MTQTQLIEALSRQNDGLTACTIGRSKEENLKLRKEGKRRRSAGYGGSYKTFTGHVARLRANNPKCQSANRL